MNQRIFISTSNNPICFLISIFFIKTITEGKISLFFKNIISFNIFESNSRTIMTIYYTHETSNVNIPYIKYFEFFPCEIWSLKYYDSLIINSYANVIKTKAHYIFFSTLYTINNNLNISQKIHNAAQKIIDDKSVSIFY